MWKKVIAGLLVAIMLLACAATGYADELIVYKSTGEMVVRVQMRLRELGYFNYKPTGVFQTMTVNATIKFQQSQTDASGKPIITDGTIGEQSKVILFSPSAVRAAIPQNVHIPIGPQLTGTTSLTGSATPWSEVKTMLQTGSAYKVIDYNSGENFYMVFVGGENHAEMECRDQADTATYKKIFGNAYNYSKRAVIIQINSTNIAASLQGQPHGDDGLSVNGMDGHACMFFEGSLSHVGALPDVEHRTLIYRASGIE